MKQAYTAPKMDTEAIETSVVIAASGKSWDIPEFNL